MLNGLIGKSEKEIFNIFKNNIIPVINSLNEIKTFYTFSKKLNINHKLTLHFDTGINRIGISQSEAEKCNKLLLSKKNKCILCNVTPYFI